MRSIKELLHLMLDNQQCFFEIKNAPPGLCLWVNNMYHTSLITVEEFISLKSYIRNYPPFIYKIYRRHGRHYWKPGDIQPRIAWIKKHIKKNK